MNINEVPQDEKDFKEGHKLKKLVYAVGPDGKYTGVNSAGWDAENLAMKQAWDAVDEALLETAEKVKAGKISPIAYFMQKSLMDVALLAKYVGKWGWQVRRHMSPSVFKSLSSDMLTRYANVFGISVDDLINFGK
ncbi:MAG TPA: hypothetical protein VGE06_01730 [Flavisolibacter sp.]